MEQLCRKVRKDSKGWGPGKICALLPFPLPLPVAPDASLDIFFFSRKQGGLFPSVVGGCCATYSLQVF